MFFTCESFNVKKIFLKMEWHILLTKLHEYKYNTKGFKMSLTTAKDWSWMTHVTVSTRQLYQKKKKHGFAW